MPQEKERNFDQMGELEAAIMSVLWSLGEASVHDVMKHLTWDKPLAYTTVMTILNRLVEKGHAHREKDGRMFLYSPVLQQEQAGRSALQQVVHRFFGGVRGRALAELLSDHEALSEEELATLEELVQRRRHERG